MKLAEPPVSEAYLQPGDFCFGEVKFDVWSGEVNLIHLDHGNMES